VPLTFAALRSDQAPSRLNAEEAEETSPFAFGLLLGALAAGIVGALVASSKNRSALLWGVLGFALGVIPVTIVALLPRKGGRSESRHAYIQPPGLSAHPTFAAAPAPRSGGQAKWPQRRLRLPSTQRAPAFTSERISDASAETLRRWAGTREPAEKAS
jgi:hypothetical protein